MIWNRIIRDFKAYIDIEDRIIELLLSTKISVMLLVVKPCSMDTPGMTHIGVGENGRARYAGYNESDWET